MWFDLICIWCLLGVHVCVWPIIVLISWPSWLLHSRIRERLSNHRINSIHSMRFFINAFSVFQFHSSAPTDCLLTVIDLKLKNNSLELKCNYKSWHFAAANRSTMSPDALAKGICVRIIWDYSWGIWCNAMIMTFLYFGCAVIKWAKKRTHKQANPIDNLRRCLIFPYLFDHTHQKIPQPHGIQSKTFQPTNCIVFCLLCYAEMCCLLCVWAAFDALLHALQFKFIFRNFSSFVAYHICNGEWPKKREEAKKNERDNNS